MASNLTNFYESLEIMLKGMGGIFIVILIFFVLIKVLERLFPVENK
ncbi:hypothetical protein Q428_09945 [Fervidicella metallireducens AeB]|uniref:Oxaloacetate decarboxylase n=1 Tax=Fervidicella metallireducens AeB TaxID=1403537 RepID=A0A017RUI5_9CLOT|nr:OadG-related small transporter subunit [Fervidicella metallireducens]EYE88049.1 hypothetical protein Q428_09945 [Fervidicella metallireducens AeB]